MGLRSTSSMLRTMLERRKLTIAGLFIVLILFHAAPFLGQTVPKVWPDEISYLSQAKFIAGKSSTPAIKPFMLSDAGYDIGNVADTRNLPYYHFGYSLLVAPAYLVTENPEYSYKIVIAINSLLMSSLFLIFYVWIRQISGLSEKKAITIAILASLYPSYNLQTHIGWSENALIPFYALSVLLLTSYLKNRRLLYLIPFSIASGYLYTIHPRGVTGSLAGIICLVAIAVADREKWQLEFLGVSLIAAMLFVTSHFTGVLSNLMGTASQGTVALGNIFSVMSLDFLLHLIGFLLYLILGTIGLFALGMAFMVNNIRFLTRKEIANHPDQSPQIAFVYIYILLSSFLLFAAGAVFLSGSYPLYDNFIDKYLYGRYNEAFLSVYLAMGLVYLYDVKNFEAARVYNFSFTFLLVISALIVWSLNDVLSEDKSMRSIHSVALYPWYLLSFGFDGPIELLGIFIGPLLWIWIMYQSRFKSRERALIIIGSYFLGMTASMLVLHSF